jgi:hypothetical protein
VKVNQDLDFSNAQLQLGRICNCRLKSPSKPVAGQSLSRLGLANGWPLQSGRTKVNDMGEAQTSDLFDNLDV